MNQQNPLPDAEELRVFAEFLYEAILPDLIASFLCQGCQWTDAECLATTTCERVVLSHKEGKIELLRRAPLNIALQNGQFRAFVWGVRRNVGLEWSRRDVLQSLEGGDQFPPNDTGPETQCEQRDTSEAIRRGLLQLHENYRTVVDLFHIQGLTIEEISTIQDKPASTVKTQLRRARIQLREILGSDQ